MTVNYEAIGRHVTATEAINTLLEKQRDIFMQIENILMRNKQNYFSNNVISAVLTENLIDLSKELNQAQVDLINAVRVANYYADDAKKPMIRLDE